MLLLRGTIRKPHPLGCAEFFLFFYSAQKPESRMRRGFGVVELYLVNKGT